MLKKNNVSFWRIIAAIVICLLHFFTTYNVYGLYPNLTPGWGIYTEFFFIVSGFLLYAKFTANRNAGKQETAFQYTKQRFLKFYPYYVFSLICLSVYSLIKGTFNILNFLNELLMLPFSVFGLNRLQNDVAWFLPVMLVAGYLIYYLLSHNEKLFNNIIAPFSVLLIYGYFYNKAGNLSTAHWLREGFFIYGGFMRAFAAMSIGVICFRLFSKRKAPQEATGRFADLPAKILEFSGFSIAIVVLMFWGKSTADFLCILILAISITLAFGNQTKVFNTKLVYRINALLFPVYLNQRFVIDMLHEVFPAVTVWLVPVYLVVLFAFSALTKKLADMVSYSLAKQKLGAGLKISGVCASVIILLSMIIVIINQHLYYRANVEVSSCNWQAGTFQVRVNNAGNAKSVKVPVWSEKAENYGDSQKDIIWYDAQKSGNNWYVDVKLADHNNDKGNYLIHVYIEEKFYASTSIEVPEKKT